MQEKKKYIYVRSQNLPKKRTKVQLCFDQEFEKTTFKILLLCHCMTLLLENLQKGTSQGYKKFDEKRFLNVFAIYAILALWNTIWLHNRQICT